MSDTTNTVRSSMESAASSAMDKVQEAASTAGKKVDKAAAALGEKAQSVAGAIRERGPQEGMLGSATGTVANTLDSAGRYLREEGLTGMWEDLTELIRRNPVPAVLIGVGIGFLLAKAIRRRP